MLAMLGEARALRAAGRFDLVGIEPSSAGDYAREAGFDVVPEFRYLTLHVMQAFKRGIIQGIDENLELIRIGKMRFLSQSVLLEKEACVLRFNYNLRDGKLPDEMRETAMHLKDLGFWTPPKLKQRVMTPEEEKSLPG